MSGLRLRTKLRNAESDVRLSGRMIGKLQRVDGTETRQELVTKHYAAYKYAKRLMIVVVLVLTLIMLGIDVGLGPYHISFTSVYQQIFDRLLDWDYYENNDMPIDMRVVWNLRLPRVLAALLAGFGLAVAGSAMQSMMKNPLADPYTTGISSGAALGATMAMTMGYYILPGDYGVVFNAFVGALIPAAFIIALSTLRKPSPAMMILTGISLMYIFNAIQSYLMLIADPNAASAVYAWTVGSIVSITWDQLPFLAVVAIAGGIAMMLMARVLNTMNSGDSYAKSIGIDINHARIVVLVIVSLIAAGIVSFTGIIGFIGLVGPHIARMFVGSDNKILIPAAGLMGACIMLLSDCVVQEVNANMPIGIITSILGGPVFMFLILRQKKEIW